VTALAARLRGASWPWWLPATLLALAPLLVAFSIAGVLTGHPVMEDLRVFRQGGAAIVHGTSLFAYGFGHSRAEPLPFTYPPFAAVVFTPLAALPLTADADLWFVLCIVTLAVSVQLSCRPLLARAGRYWPLVVGAVSGLCLFTDPVREVFDFGQLGLPIMALCLVDLLVERPRWPRGVLIGIATAVKLIPGLFVVYFLVTRRLREAARAAIAFVACTLLSLAVDPHDTWQYWTSLVFDNKRVGGPAYYSNQAIYGAMERIHLGGAAETAGWLLLSAVALWLAWLGASRAHRAGAEVLAVTIVGMASELVSPVAWIHHLVWIVPAAGVLAGDLRPWWRAILPLAIIGWFTVQLPEVGEHMFLRYGTSHWVNFLEDFFCLGCVLLLGALVLAALRLPAPGAHGHRERRPASVAAHA
jgi:alpha-1,2-mannosyltransferase